MEHFSGEPLQEGGGRDRVRLLNWIASGKINNQPLSRGASLSGPSSAIKREKHVPGLERVLTEPSWRWGTAAPPLGLSETAPPSGDHQSNESRRGSAILHLLMTVVHSDDTDNESMISSKRKYTSSGRVGRGCITLSSSFQIQQ